MELSALAANAALSMLFGAKQRQTAPAERFAAPEQPANLARPQQTLPANAAAISFDAALFLQSEAASEPAIQTPSATELFLAEIQKDPIERMREQIMKELGLSEDDLAQMTPDERRAVEDEISAIIQERLRQGFGGDRNAETAAEYLAQGMKA